MVVDKVIDKVIGIIILAAVWGSLVGTVLSWFTNLSGSGLILAVLFSTILPIVLAVAVYKSISKLMKF